MAGRFVLAEWNKAGLNVETALKRGVYTLEETLVRKRVGTLDAVDAAQPDQLPRAWLALL